MSSNKFLLIGVVLLAAVSGSLTALAAVESGADSDTVAASANVVLVRELSRAYPGTRVELTAPVRWLRGAPGAEVTRIVITAEGLRGDVRFSALDRDNVWSEGIVGFTATVPAWIATRRIHPGEKLAPELFVERDLNVGWGAARDYRGVLLSTATLQSAELARLETRQTILEGQFLVSTAVQKVPDIRRGDSVTIWIQSDGLSLSTQGVAQEAASLNGSVRVLTAKSKRELVGTLKTPGQVEVKL